MTEKKIKVRLLPLMNIGGIGKADDEVWLAEAEARYWVKEGYVEIISDESKPIPVPAKAENPEPEDHAIMKPKSKRRE